MSISRAFRSSALLVALLIASACGGQAADAPGVTVTATATPPSPEPSATPESLDAGPAASDDIWLEQPFGPDGQLAVLFYDDGGQSCVRFLVDVPGATPVSACGDPARDALTAVQAPQADSAGTLYTIIVGRVFKPATRVVAVEVDGGATFSVNVDGDGVILILEGERRAVQAVPIDAFGNLTGGIFRF
ncbi:MAG: hypothetical protein IT323_19175 [Anaerolineae bacterium]|nr:hypothetical protein [Anaerolineae bacterium]